MKPCRICLMASVAALVLWGGYRAYRAHYNLVTLDVRNMELRRVVSKLEWQTWEHIVVNNNVGGRVTLNVHNVPLEEVLNIVGLQTDSKWTRLYPLYLGKKSLTAFNQVLQGNVAPAGNGWLALEQLSAWQQGSLGGFGNTLRAENKVVSAQLVNKDVTFTALALSRFSKAQIVPEDGINRSVTLTLQQVPFDRAVAKVAKQVRRNWKRVYTLQPLNGIKLVRQKVPVNVGTNATPEMDTNVVVMTPQQPVPALPPESALEALTSTMTPEEKEQTLQQVANFTQAGGGGGGGGVPYGGGQQPMQAGSSPAAQAAQAAAQAETESRIETRLKDGTVDQRLAHDRRVLNSKKAGGK